MHELMAGEGHGQRGGPSASLGVDDLSASVLDAHGQGITLGIREGDGGRGLACENFVDSGWTS